ncbi:sulfite exporter TauE/SafE family protein [Methanocaldococcus sp. 10A]
MGSLIFVILGFIVGAIVGLTGIGGGVLMAPSLIFLGVEPLVAIGTDLIYASITKSLGSYFHNKKGNVNSKIALMLFFGSIPSMILGYFILEFFNRDIINRYLTLFLGVVLVFTSLMNLKKDILKDVKCSSTYILILFGFLTGLVVQFTSVGSGVLATFALMHFTSLSPREVIGTSLVYGLLICLLGALMHAELGNVNYNLALYLTIGTIPGVYVGVSLNSKIKQKNLRKIMTTVILFMGLILLIKGIYILLF